MRIGALRPALALVPLLVLGAGCGRAEEAPAARAAARETGGTGDLAPRRAAAAPAEAGPAPAGGGAELPRGLLVWESDRSRAWRIWRRDLPAGPPQQLTRNEPGRRHCCPHLSPDGARLAYLSLPDGAGEYPRPEETGELRLLDLASGREEVVAAAARTYLEHRAAIWHGPDRLVYIDGEGYTVRRDLRTGELERLTRRPRTGYGWLIDATERHATMGLPSFSPYDPPSRTVEERGRLAGCQPYFSADGRWGYWTAGAGGPLARMELASRVTGTIVAKNDPRLPHGLGYLYFPMLSADGRLFAFGASAGEHDHHRSDYEIFVAETDPESLQLLGAPVRMTRDPGVDRFPDVWAEPLPLGSRRGEAPFAAELRAPQGGGWSWDLGDGTRAEGETVRHTWARPGRYRIAARSTSGAEAAGEVLVAPARPPAVVDVALRERGGRVDVLFDEPVSPGPEVAISFGSGRQVADWSLSEDGRRLAVVPAEPVIRPERLVIAGFRDRAGEPNVLPATTLELEPPLWPSDRDGLQLLWQTGDAPNLVPDAETGADRAVQLEPSGRAHLDHHFRMVAGGGLFTSTQEEGNRLRWALQRTNELTLEVTLTPAAASQTGRVVSFAGRGGENFSLWQRGGVFGWSLRVGSPRSERPDAALEIGALPAGRASHLVLTHSPSRTRVWIDGELRLESDAVTGDFFQFRSLPLTVGGRAAGGGDWAGTVEGLAIWSRVLPDEEVRENHLRYQALVERRPEVPSWEVEAEVVAVSDTPTAQEITPYRQALRTVDYRVVRWLAGEPEGERLRVVEWAMLDGRTLPAAAPGARERLRLERFADNPQLEGLYLSDTLGSAAPVAPFYAPGSAAR